MVTLDTLRRDLAQATSIDDRLALAIQISIAEILEKELYQKYKGTPIDFEEVVRGTARGFATGLHSIACSYNPHNLKEQGAFMGDIINTTRDFSMRILHTLYTTPTGMTRQ